MARPLRARVVLGLRKDNYAKVLVFAWKVHAKLLEHASMFPAPNPDLDTLLQQIEAYEKLQLAVVGPQTRGAAEAREVQRNVLWGSLESERAYVQQLADAAPERAAEYAVRAGMRLAHPPIPHRFILVPTRTTVPGTVDLVAAASLLEGPGKGKARQRTYLWRYTLDGGATFLAAEPTPVARTTIKGLPLRTEVGFQVAVKDAVGPGEWSQTVTLLVH